MELTLIPETAPFSPPQRAWLNGFFAGLLNGARQAPPAAAPPGAPVAQEENHPWHDPALKLDARLELAQGRPVEDRLMAAMAQLDCGACGYLCRTYSRAIADGSEADLTRCVPGGAETARTLKKIFKESPPPVAVTVNGTSTAKKAAVGYDRENPYPAPILAVKPLNNPGSAKDTRFVALDLAGSGLSYEPGDSLGVYPQNCPDTVGRIVEALGVSGNEPVAGSGAAALVPLSEALLSYRTITAVDETQALMLAECASEKSQASDLRELAGDEAAMSRFDLLDLLLEYRSAKPRPADLIAALRPLQPRLYSIASSLKAHPDEVHLTVGVVRYELDGRPRRGVASTFFAERTEVGRRVRIFIQKSHGFRLPADPAAPLIMVGPGTGISPFRAFLQERGATSSSGDHWLFFGDQHESTDFLYKHELDRYLADGVLTRLDTAFSRDSEQKVYVQHRMLENSAELWRWLERGAHFYVCGDAQRMAGDVERVLHRIIAQRGGMDEPSAKAYLAELSKAGRYQRDVY